MERLTTRLKSGRTILIGNISQVFNPKIGRFCEGKAVDKLADYEDAEENDSYGKWIPVSERLPEEYGSYLVAWRRALQSKEMVEELTGGFPHFVEILEFDPDVESKWIGSIEQAEGEYVILAWMPLPEPYRESEVQE